MSLVRQCDLENSERTGEELNGNGRLSYAMEEAQCIKERYVRVAAIIMATIEGSKNNYTTAELPQAVSLAGFITVHALFLLITILHRSCS